MNSLSVAIANAIPSYTASRNGPSRIWRSRCLFCVPAHITRDMILVRQLLLIHLADTIWSRPIGLLFPRSPRMEVFIDALYEGLGDWSSAFNF